MSKFVLAVVAVALSGGISCAASANSYGRKVVTKTSVTAVAVKKTTVRKTTVVTPSYGYGY